MHERQLTYMTLKKTATSISAQSSTMWRKRPVQPVLCAILIVPVKELVQEIDHYLSFSGHSRRGSGIGVYVHCFLGDSYWKHLYVYVYIYIYEYLQHLHFRHTYSTHSFDFEHDTRVRRSDLLQPAKTGCQQ